jgi:hypothetical protein
LVQEDEDTLKELGFTYATKGYRKGMEEIEFRADGTASYFSDYIKNYPIVSFESVKDGMEYLWDKYSTFIEEKLTYKRIMRSMLE